ncbi:MAG: hypothetical protein P8Z35_20410 [Ignavibacteriaceae bacterium]
MRIRLLLIMLALGLGYVLAQSNYPVISIHDIQYYDSVGTKNWQPSAYTGDTVRVVGIIMIRPLIDPDTNRTPVMYYGSRWGTYIQDTSVAATAEGWGGLNVLQNDTTGDNQNTFFDLRDTADVVEMTGVVTKYNDTNELMLLLNPVTPVNPISHLAKRPDPLVLNMTDLTNNGVTVKEGYKYCGTYVELRDLVTSDRSANSFNINDDKGNSITAYGQSRYYRTDNNKVPGSTYQPPVDGTHLSYIRGILSNYSGNLQILPIYPDDIHITLLAPSISLIKRDPVQVKTNDQVTISANVQGGSGYLTDVELHYKVGDQDRIAESETRTELLFK